ncbi:MAG TPA: ATP-binding protein [Thermoleophilaceae bacterium]
MGSVSASRIEFPATPDRLPEARAFVDDIAISFGFDEDARYDLKLAATEAVSNAIRHGARSERDTVSVCAAEGNGTLTFCVADHGTFLTNLDDVDPLPEQGRGLAFIAHLMDQVCIRTGEDGTVVRFSKRLPETR